jgi:hypothetical protein
MENRAKSQSLWTKPQHTDIIFQLEGIAYSISILIGEIIIHYSTNLKKKISSKRQCLCCGLQSIYSITDLHY